MFVASEGWQSGRVRSRQAEQTSGSTKIQILRGASSSKRPRRHQRELFSPERVAVRSDALGHDDVRACTPQCGRPPRRVLEKEGLQRAGNEICARKRTRHHGRRSIATARRCAEDRTVDVRVSKPHGERQLSARRHAEHRGALDRQCDSETRLHPSADILDEELL